MIFFHYLRIAMVSWKFWWNGTTDDFFVILNLASFFSKLLCYFSLHRIMPFTRVIILKAKSVPLVLVMGDEIFFQVSLSPKMATMQVYKTQSILLFRWDKNISTLFKSRHLLYWLPYKAGYHDVRCYLGKERTDEFFTFPKVFIP